MLLAVLAFFHLRLQRCGGSEGPKDVDAVLNISRFVALPNTHTVVRTSGRFVADDCADRTCPYGAWLCDRLVEGGQKLLDWETDIAMYPAGALRGGLPEGLVTTGVLKGLHMAADVFAQVRLNGSAIEQILLQMLDRHGEQGGKDACFLQTGGLRYKAFWDKAWDIDVVEVWQQGTWRLLDPEAQYNLITDGALLGPSACNYSHLQEASGVLKGSQTRVLLFELLSLQKSRTISPPVNQMDRACLYTVSCSWTKTIGVALDDFHSNESVCRRQTCSYGIFLAEALLEHGRAAGKRSQIALFNAGSIQSSLDAGKVSWEDIADVHPYPAKFVYAELPAFAIKKVLEEMLNSKGFDSTSGAFMQMAGLRFYAEWDPLLKSWDLGTTQVVVNDDWLTVDMRSSIRFRVVINSFLMKGGDGFPFLKGFPCEEAGNVRSLMIRKFLAEGSVRPPEVDQRHCFSTNCAWLPVLATAEEQLDGDPSSCGDDTCGLGVVACEALLQLGQQLGRSPHAVFLRAGVLGGSIPPGEVTYDLLEEIFPQGEAFAQTWLTGSEIRRILQAMMGNHGPPGTGQSPNFMQLAGMRMRAIWDAASQNWSLLGVEVRNASRWQALELEAIYRVIVEERFCTESGIYPFLQHRWKEALGVLRTQLALYFQKLGSIRAPPDDDRHCFTPLSCRYLSRDDEEAAAAERAGSAGPKPFLGPSNHSERRNRFQMPGAPMHSALPTLIAVAALALIAAALAALTSSSRGGSRDMDIAGASLLDNEGGQPSAADAAAIVEKDAGPLASDLDGSNSFTGEEPPDREEEEPEPPDGSAGATGFAQHFDKLTNDDAA